MVNTIISEGKNLDEAIDKGIEKLCATRENVKVEVIEEKRKFFDILSPKKVQVRLSLVESTISKCKSEEKKSLDKKDVKEKVDDFLKEFIKFLPDNTEYTMNFEEDVLKIKLSNSELGFLIGYCGETLYSLQEVISVIANKVAEQNVIVDLDIEDYKYKKIEKIKLLIEKTVTKVLETKKTVKLDPMKAYERKVVHTLVQDIKNIETSSEGSEPYRKVVISYKNI